MRTAGLPDMLPQTEAQFFRRDELRIAELYFLNAKMVSICSYIPELPPNAREYPKTSGIRRNGINVVKNGFLFYGGVFPVKIITAFLRMSTILIYILVFSPVWIPLYFMNNGAVIHFFLKEKKGKKKR